ncbi:hypothetical protein MTO96_032496 [Rhipicephalus appendiculatus]
MYLLRLTKLLEHQDKERIDGLRDKDTALAELDKQIADALDGEEFDAEIVGALEYHERIVKAISRLRSAINVRAPVGSTINETNQPRHAATVWASGTGGRVPVRLLLDTGSQRTFIRKDLSQQLRLSCTGTEEVDVFTFGGSTHPRHYQCRRVNVTLRGRREPIDVDLEALEVPELCTVNGPTLEPNVIAMMRDRNLAFADETQGDQPQDSTISVLIGSDHYWRVVTGRVERFTDTLCAVETIFGWVIQGVCANVNHRLSPRNISATALFLACADNWCTEVLPGDPSDIWRLDAIGITDGQDDVSKHPALLHFRSTPVGGHQQQDDSGCIYECYPKVVA